MRRMGPIGRMILCALESMARLKRGLGRKGFCFPTSFDKVNDEDDPETRWRCLPDLLLLNGMGT